MNKIRVYAADVEELKDDAVFIKYCQTVSMERRKKIDQFLFQKDKLLSLAAELLLGEALRREGIHSWKVYYGDNGKPYIDNLYFNLSHSGEQVMCAVSEYEVGCDVEKVTDIDLEIARHFFYGTEYDRIMEQTTVQEQREMFFRLWTLKESFMKATGLGMQLPLDAFRIDISDRKEQQGKEIEKKDGLGSESKICICQKVNKENYYFKEYQGKNGYRYAVCGLVPEFENMEVVSFTEETRWNYSMK